MLLKVAGAGVEPANSPVYESGALNQLSYPAKHAIFYHLTEL